MEPQDNKPVKSYGKRPRWQWIAIYVIAAAVVYFVIYWFFIRDSGGSSSGGLY